MSGSTSSEIDGRPKVLTGLVGRDILASRSPWMHEEEGKAQGLDLSYTLFDFSARGLADKALPQVLADAERQGFSGLNITFPFKQAIIPHLDALSDGARQVGAVNTVSFAGGKRTGYNTDVTGFAENFTRGLPGVAKDRVVQIGAGGAGSATAQALLSCGVGQLILFDIDAARQEELISKLQADFGADRVTSGADLTASAKAADGIVNATPIGMAKLPGLPLPADCIEKRHWVADIVYFPLETELLREAKARGCQILDGSGMAILQAAAAFEIFTGTEVNIERMKLSFLNFHSGQRAKAA